MLFRDLKIQYRILKPEIDRAIDRVLTEGCFIAGRQVVELEEQLAAYVGMKHCITCGNGTDALILALMVWGIGERDVVFVPDFTFFASGEAVVSVGAVPVFVDVEKETFNMSPDSLELAVKAVLREGKYNPAAVVAVDLFGQPADYERIREIADNYGLYILEDGAQGFGGGIGGQKSCSFGDISTTSFFPAKPLGCYGDGGAVFTDNEEWAALLRSLCIHGKGEDKYDNVRIGMNSRLDTMQAAILQVKLKAFREYELEDVNRAAAVYTREILGRKELEKFIKSPFVREEFYSCWAQYSVLLRSQKERDGLKAHLKQKEIPSMVYYPKPLHEQKAFAGYDCVKTDLNVSTRLCERVLSLPLHPYIREAEQMQAIDAMEEFFAG